MKKDPIEDSKEFRKALKKIQPQLEILSQQLNEDGYGLGSCHRYWARKKELLKAQGIDWKTPAECNSSIIFD